MIKNKVVEKKVEVPDLIICDICKKEYSYDKDIMDIQEFVGINIRAGYGSIFGDDSTVEIDICQHCLDDKLGQYLRINSPFDNMEGDN